MPIQFDNYAPTKIENLKNHLISMASKGSPKFYEIFVDSLKAVPKTDEPNHFDSYEDYMTQESEQIRIVIYNSNLSPRNDQYVFVLKARNRDEANNMGLQGFAIKSFSKNSLSGWRNRQVHQSIESKDFEITQLKKEISELKKEVAEAEEDYEALQQELNEANAQIEIAKKNSNKLGGVHFGDIASVALEGLIRRNTHIIAKIPGGSGLAGLIEKDNNRDASDNFQQADTEVSFKKKSQSTETKNETVSEPVLTENEKRFIAIMKELEKHFSEEEMSQIMMVLEYFSKNRDFLEEVIAEISSEGEENQNPGQDK